LHFDAASAPFHSRVAHLLTSHADHDPLSEGTSLCAFGPTAFADPGNPTFRLLAKASRRLCPADGRSRSRVWLPFQRPQVSQPSEASFSPQRSWASLFRAFLRHDDRSQVSQASLRPRAFPRNPSASYRRLGGLVPPCQPYPSSLPECLARVGAWLLS